MINKGALQQLKEHETNERDDCFVSGEKRDEVYRSDEAVAL
jgi:hypothetical protein